MIRLLDNTYTLFEKNFPDDHENPFLCRILSLYKVYGTDAPFADFWIQTDDFGKPVSALSRLDSQLVAFFTCESNLEETAEFIYALGVSSVLYDSCFNLPVKYPVVENGCILKFSSKIIRIIDFDTEVPKVKTLFDFLKKTDGFSLADEESFRLDISHKLLKKCARVYAVVKNNEPVSCAMTVAETENAAVIGAVSTDVRYNNNGFASSLVNKLCRELADEGKIIYVYTKNGMAGFYKRLGFVNYGSWTELRLM